MSIAASPLFRLAPLLLLAIAWAWPLSAAAQVKRCTTNSGATIYTDKACKSIGAADRVPRGQHIGLTSTRRSGCARNLQDLIYEITAATDQRDVNRLGAVYHWVGVSPQTGDRILDRLQAIVDRPLVDIVAIRSARRYASEPIADVVPASPEIPPSSNDDNPSETPMSPPAPRRAVGGGPVALRLEQTLRNTATPSRTILGLRRHYDCWWVVLPAQ
jgi:hypothetical protein